MSNELSSENVSLLKQIANNLGIDDIRQGSYLNTLVRGLLDINEKSLESINNKLANINIDTADGEALEEFGSKRNLPRFKSNSYSLLAKEKGLSLKLESFNSEEAKNIKIFEQGNVQVIGSYLLTFLEDCWVNTSLKEVYISCSISVLEGMVSQGYIPTGTSFNLDVPSEFKEDLVDLKVEFKRDIYLSNFEENIEIYRARLKHSLSTLNLSNQNSITLLLNTVPYVSQYYIDETTTPYRIYIFNNAMYRDKMVAKSLEDESIPYASFTLDRYRGFSSSFEFEIAERVSYSIALEYTSDFSLELFNGIGNLLYNPHRLGDYFNIGENDLRNYLNDLGLDKPFKYKIYYHYNGVEFEAPDPYNLSITPIQFPYLESFTVNGEPVSVLY